MLLFLPDSIMMTSWLLPLLPFIPPLWIQYCYWFLFLQLITLLLLLFSLPTFIIIDHLHFFNTILTIICKTILTIEDHRHMGLSELIILLPMMAIWGHHFQTYPHLAVYIIQVPFKFHSLNLNTIHQHHNEHIALHWYYSYIFIFLQDSMMITIFITIHPSIMDAPLLHQLYDTLPLL